MATPIPTKKGHGRSAGTLGVLCILAALPLVALAAPVIRSGETVSVDAGQIVEGDFYAFGNAVTISGEIEEDAHIAAGTVTVNAPVGTDLTVAGGSVQVHAPIGDDLRVVGGEVTLASEVGGDVVVAGGVLRVLSTADVAGDILVASGDVRVEGPVGGSIFGYAEVMRIDAAVGGNVTVRADRGLTLGDRAEVGGDISYSSAAELARAPGAVVVGDIAATPLERSERTAEFFLVPLIMVMFAALSLLLLARDALQSVVEDVRTSYGVNGLLGLGFFVITPFIAIILLLSILGFWVGLFAVFAYIALLLLSFVVAGVLAGSFILEFFTKSRAVTFVSVILGVLSLQLVLTVPFLGPLFVLAVTLIALGTIVRRCYHRIT